MGRYQNVVDAQRLYISTLALVLDDNLTLHVGAQPRDFLGVTQLSHLFAEAVREVVRVGVQNLSVPLVSGVAKHEALVPSP